MAGLHSGKKSALENGRAGLVPESVLTRLFDVTSQVQPACRAQQNQEAVGLRGLSTAVMERRVRELVAWQRSAVTLRSWEDALRWRLRQMLATSSPQFSRLLFQLLVVNFLPK